MINVSVFVFFLLLRHMCYAGAGGCVPVAQSGLHSEEQVSDYCGSSCDCG